jgi:hypothetical protein
MIPGFSSGSTFGSKAHPLNVNQNLDAFGRLRVSNTKTLFDSVQTYSLSPFFWDQITANGGTVTYVSNSNLARLTCTGTTNSRAVNQTHNYLGYQPAKSQYIKCTSALGVGSLYVVLRSSVGGSVVESRIAQADFNRDTIDGQGASGFEIDTTKANIFTIDFQYLGVGLVRFGVVGSDGSLIPAHYIQNANNNTGLYMLTAMLPFRTEIVNDGTDTYKRMGFFDDNDGLFFEVKTTGADSMDFFCCSIESEDGQGIQEERGIPFSASTNGVAATIDATLSPILSIRPKLTFKTKTNRGLIVPNNVEALVSSRDVRFDVILNPTLTGASFASVNDESIAEFDTAATAFTGGYKVKSFYLEASASASLGSEGLLSRIALSVEADGLSSDILTIAAVRLNQTTTGYISLDWKELY